ncbi:TPA: DUF2232 domain-containing protein [bacterium]|nr:DUF2232 domain-containing protein [bacterium]
MNKIKPLTQAGLFAALHVVLLIVSNAIIGVDFILIVGLPFASALYSLKNKPLHTLLFFVATSLICFPIDLIKTLLYIIPSLVSGIAYGYLIKLKFNSLSLIYTLTFISSLLFLFSIFIIDLVYHIDFIDLAKSFFNISETTFNNYGPSLILLIGFCQSILTHIIIKEELNRMNIKVNNNYDPSFFFVCFSLVALIISLILFNTTYLNVAIYFMFIYLITFIPIIIYAFSKTNKHFIFLVIGSLFILFVTLPLMKKFPSDSILMLITFFFLPYYLKTFVILLTNMSKNVVK